MTIVIKIIFIYVQLIKLSKWKLVIFNYLPENLMAPVIQVSLMDPEALDLLAFQGILSNL